MTNKYVNFISDEHLLNCIDHLFHSYLSAKRNLTKTSFYTNKIDTIKLTFDSKFSDITEEDLIQVEVLRQIDKTINNAIGTFHEEVLGGISGFYRGNHSGYDIKKLDDTLFADIKNKHNTVNSSSAESLFQKLSQYANNYPNAKCYFVQIFAKSSFNKKWEGSLNGTYYQHDRVYQISGDQFYKLLSKQDDAFYQLYKSLPIAISDYLETITKSEAIEHSALSEINNARLRSKRTIIDQITFENFRYYLGFNKL